MVLLMVFNPPKLRLGCLRRVSRGDKTIWAHKGFVITDTVYTFESCDNVISSHNYTCRRLDSTFYGADGQFRNMAFQ